jgi:(p)ppGpp synthase/HD superfamily hydrolase
VVAPLVGSQNGLVLDVVSAATGHGFQYFQMMTGTSPRPVLRARFVEAVAFAIRAHGDQCRKGGDIPYVAHLLGVASLVLEAGGDEDLAIAGLLHDTIEDTETTAQDLESVFGQRVAAIVEACTDANERPKPAWQERKERYLSHLRSCETPMEVLVVSRADKLHNARAILLDYRDVGEQLWGRFKEGPGQQLWYYRSLVNIFTQRLPGPMSDELSRVVSDLNDELTPAR